MPTTRNGPITLSVIQEQHYCRHGEQRCQWYFRVPAAVCRKSDRIILLDDGSDYDAEMRSPYWCPLLAKDSP